MKTKYIALIVVIAVIGGAIAYLQIPSKREITIEGKLQQLGILSKIGEDNIGLNVGQIAPDFALLDINGNVIKLSDFRDKIVFINFWASWCPFCIDEMPDIQKVAMKYDDVTVLFINRGENIETAITYVNNRLPVKITYPILQDPGESVSKVYILYGMPVSYIIDKNGVIKYRKFGPLTAEEIESKLQNVLGV